MKKCAKDYRLEYLKVDSKKSFEVLITYRIILLCFVKPGYNIKSVDFAKIALIKSYVLADLPP